MIVFAKENIRGREEENKGAGDKREYRGIKQVAKNIKKQGKCHKIFEPYFNAENTLSVPLVNWLKQCPIPLCKCLIYL